MSEKMKELNQYFFSREDFTEAFADAFGTDYERYLLKIADVANSRDRLIENFAIIIDPNEEVYIIHLPSGIQINWYKLYHLGRTNTCNRSDFTKDDLRDFFVKLKIQLDLFYEEQIVWS